MAKISVIIPVYNTEKYIGKCLESVTGQTMADLEIICIDDGSTDNSAVVLDAYAHADARIKVIHKKNEGLVSARKAGIREATSKYTAYVDSDDFIEPDMYEKLYTIIERTKSQLVTCGYYLEGGYTTIHLDTVEGGFYEKDRMDFLREHTIYHLKHRETGLRGGLWCKLFSSALLKKVQEEIPDDISIAEDKVCLLRYILECSSVYVLKEPLYHWVIRKDSMSRKSNEYRNDYLEKVNKAYNFLMSLYSHPAFTETMRFQAEVYIMELLLLGINKRMGFKNRNMIWIDPDWLKEISFGARVVLYGSGELEEKYRQQLLHLRPDLILTGSVELCGRCEEDAFFKKLKNMDYDYIVIVIKNRGKAEAVRNMLLYRGISDENIIWKEQPEVYWKYMEAEGLLDKYAVDQMEKNNGKHT